MNRFIKFLAIALFVAFFVSCSVTGAAINAQEEQAGSMSRTEISEGDATTICRHCYVPGSGLCFECKGAGSTVQTIFQIRNTCKACNGTGKCRFCGGTGHLVVN